MTNKINLCEDELFRKVITPPLEEFQNYKIKPANYMIQDVGENFLLYRELNEEEPSQSEEMQSRYEGKRYVFLYNFPSEEEALQAIHSYWDAIKQLNSFEE
ncbi:hypothetical protein CSW12_31055 (plasmid) [Bacillus cereus]|uniref:hypothetical protein n=1 Tax=Bacillus TaxID=1386 RepID=UPI000C2D64BD|nr:hypothetical protein [Bacillus cereus]AUB67269.1 hypothetical protein CSW12_31055 [Bacillus cereus]